MLNRENIVMDTNLYGRDYYEVWIAKTGWRYNRSVDLPVKKWKEEDCCYGMEVNTKSDLNEPLAVALDKGKIVGYIFGHFYSQEKKTSYMK